MLINTNMVVVCSFEGFFIFVLIFYIFINLIMLESVIPEMVCRTPSLHCIIFN